jgi:pimeloyl-ACP methyl ester carboxylesterase
MTEHLSIGENTIAYDLPGDGPLVVLAHGMGDSRHSYRFIVPALAAAGYRVANVDIRGCGDSSLGWSGYSRTDIAVDPPGRAVAGKALPERVHPADGGPHRGKPVELEEIPRPGLPDQARRLEHRTGTHPGQAEQARPDEGPAGHVQDQPRRRRRPVTQRDLPAGLGELIVIDGAGHYPHAQTPDQVLALALPFLAKTLTNA